MGGIIVNLANHCWCGVIDVSNCDSCKGCDNCSVFGLTLSYPCAFSFFTDRRDHVYSLFYHHLLHHEEFYFLVGSLMFKNSSISGTAGI